MAYSKEDIKKFDEKDLRISKIAILKSLIESGRNSADEVNENCVLAEQYVNYLYSELTCEKKDEPVACSDKVVRDINWKQEAESMDVPVPNEKNIEVLLSIIEGYKEKHGGAKVTPNNLLATIYKAYNKYPTNKASTSKILELF
jgi:hypothetical protein